MRQEFHSFGLSRFGSIRRQVEIRNLEKFRLQNCNPTIFKRRFRIGSFVEMVDVRTVAVSLVAVLSVFLQHGIRAQPTIDSSSETLDSCSQLKVECAVENIRLRSE